MKLTSKKAKTPAKNNGGQSNVIRWVAISKKLPPEGVMVVCGHSKDKWVHTATWHKFSGGWDAGVGEIYPTHWAVVDPPCK